MTTSLNRSIQMQFRTIARDPAVPPVNAEFLHERLPKSKLDIINAGHINWEEAPDEYAALVTSWWSGGCANTGTEAGR